jgi:hypothetical protein
MLVQTRPVILKPPPRRPRKVAVRADLNQAIELTGKSIGLFVLFTTTMNWWFYRRIRKDVEEKKKD